MHRNLWFAAALAVAGTPALAQAPAAKSFNPDISLILQGRYVDGKSIDDRHITGFAPAGHEHGGDVRGFSLDHSELTISGNIDPYFRGYATFAIADDEVEVEEAWIQALALGAGFTIFRFYKAHCYRTQKINRCIVNSGLCFRCGFKQNLRTITADIRTITGKGALVANTGLSASSGHRQRSESARRLAANG
jgi:hypothetical protein